MENAAMQCVFYEKMYPFATFSVKIVCLFDFSANIFALNII